jgi:mono/diheme cytochrome c family protein
LSGSSVSSRPAIAGRAAEQTSSRATSERRRWGNGQALLVQSIYVRSALSELPRCGGQFLEPKTAFAYLAVFIRCGVNMNHSRLPRIGAQVAFVVLFGLSLFAQRRTTKAGPADPVFLKKGEYLARAGDCEACHTAPGGKPFAGGHYLDSQYGGFFVPNITPDKATGIRDWRDDDFCRAMHEGIGRGGDYLYPAFPFPWFTKVTREDVLAIRAYLFSLPPEHSPRKPEKIPFPLNVRESLLAWRTLFLKPGEYQPDPAKSDALNRGAYLVEGLGHCGECHNRSNILGGSDLSGLLEGGQIEGWYAPNIRSDGSEGVGQWTPEQLATFLKTGAAPGKDVVLGPMGETVRHSLSHLTDPDIEAIAAYLKSVPAESSYKPVASDAFRGPNALGASTYLTHCAFCHMPDGKGVVGAIPALQGNGAVTAKGPEDAIRVVLGGLPASAGLAPMPAVGAGMTDEEVAVAVDYARQSWGNAAPVSEGLGIVGDLRAKTRILLAANLPDGCPPVDDPGLAKAIEQFGVSAWLKTVKDGDPKAIAAVLQHLLPKAKALAPDAKGDDIVNALTAAYCPIVATGAKPQAAQAAALGNFSGLVYEQLKHGATANRADAR